MYGKSALCHCWPSPPAEICLICTQVTSVQCGTKSSSVTEGEPGLELAEPKCEAELKSDLYLVAIQEMLMLIPS